MSVTPLPLANPPALAPVLRPALEHLGFGVQRLDSPTQMLLLNRRYKAARQAALAAGILLPAHSQPF